MLQRAPKPVLRLPSLVAWGLRPLPLLPLEIALRHLLAGIIERHPDLTGRLDGGPSRLIAIDPNDLPFVILLDTQGGTITLQLVREIHKKPVHARICGPLLALIGLVDGTYDGDALFFSRDLTIEGDIEAVLALRNAVDDADVDLLREVAASAGAFAQPLDRVARSVVATLRHAFGKHGRQ
jgi:predicted lipid carrier protein YhbT